MAKFSQKLVNKIVSMIEEDNYTITDICTILGINRKTYYSWKCSRDDFAEAISVALENREERLKMIARQAIRKKLGGYKMVETKTVYAIDKKSEVDGQMTVKEYIVKDKYCVPETSAIAFALTDKDRTWKGGRKVPRGETRPLNIVVNSKETKDEIELLRRNLQDPNFMRGTRG